MADQDPSTVERGEPGDPHDHVVPMRLYKTITVFSTLSSVVLVVLGFAFLDAATLQANPLLAAVRAIPVSVPIDQGLFTVVAAAIGLGLIAFGGWVYLLATRFRTEAMGNAQTRSDRSDDNG